MRTRTKDTLGFVRKVEIVERLRPAEKAGEWVDVDVLGVVSASVHGL